MLYRQLVSSVDLLHSNIDLSTNPFVSFTNPMTDGELLSSRFWIIAWPTCQAVNRVNDDKSLDIASQIS